MTNLNELYEQAEREMDGYRKDRDRVERELGENGRLREALERIAAGLWAPDWPEVKADPQKIAKKALAADPEKP